MAATERIPTRREGKGSGCDPNSEVRAPSNNFMRFKEALAKKALLEFGNLGKLINQGYTVIPDLPDRDTYGLDDDPLRNQSCVACALSLKIP